MLLECEKDTKFPSDLNSDGNVVNEMYHGPLLTERTDVLLQEIVKTHSHKSVRYNDRIALKCDWYLGNAAAREHVSFQSSWESLNSNLAALKLYENLQ